MAGAATLVSSPLGRAVATAEALGLAAPLVRDVRWIELDYGEHEGALPGELSEELWRRWRGDATYRPAGGESLADVGARAARATS